MQNISDNRRRERRERERKAAQLRREAAKKKGHKKKQDAIRLKEAAGDKFSLFCAQYRWPLLIFGIFTMVAGIGFVLVFLGIYGFTLNRFKKLLPKELWQRFFYAFGWLTGVINIVFWGWQYIMYLTRDEHENDFIQNNKHFHRRTYYYGIVMSILSVLVTIAAYLDL